MKRTTLATARGADSLNTSVNNSGQLNRRKI
jgi:hypothetical protein